MGYNHENINKPKGPPPLAYKTSIKPSKDLSDVEYLHFLECASLDELENDYTTRSTINKLRK